MRAEFESSQVDHQHDRLAGERATLEARIGRLADAIGAGTLSVPELVAQLQDAQRRRQAVTEALSALEDRRGDRPPEWAIVEAQARTLFRDWRGLLTRDPTEARPVLRQLLEGRRIRFTPIENGKERAYRFEGDAGVGGVLEGLAACRGNWRPHRDSSAERSDGR